MSIKVLLESFTEKGRPPSIWVAPSWARLLSWITGRKWPGNQHSALCFQTPDTMWPAASQSRCLYFPVMTDSSLKLWDSTLPNSFLLKNTLMVFKFCLYMCMGRYMHVSAVPIYFQKRASDLLGIKLRSSRSAFHTLRCRAISPVPAHS